MVERLTIMETIESPKLGFVDRIKEAAGVIVTGRRINPLAEEPQEGDGGNMVKQWQDRILSAREFWQPTFKKIKEEQAFAAGKQWPDGSQEWFSEKYVGDRIQQLLNRLCASRYAKNPKTSATVRERMQFAVWDESEESLAGAKAILQAAAPILEQAAQAAALGLTPSAPPPPEIEMAQAIMRDYEQGMAEKALYAKVARTAALLVQQQWDTQTPEFIVSMKSLVTRVDTSRVGYIKVSYRRDEKPREPMQNAKIVDLQARLQTLKSQLEKIKDGEIDADSAEADETALLLKRVTEELSVEEKPEFEDEGPVDDFLTATSVIIDPATRSLKEFIGASWICHEMLMDIAEAESAYGVSLFDVGAVLYDESGPQASGAQSPRDKASSERKRVCVWNVEDKNSGMSFVLIDGVRHFIKQPHVNLPKVKRFWSIVPLTYHVTEVETNDPVNDVTCYGKSTVRRVMPMQVNINSKGEEFRQTLIANRPGWLHDKSKVMDNDLIALNAQRIAHTSIGISGMNGGKVSDFISARPVQPIDPMLYNTSVDDQAMLLAGGVQASNMGGQNPGETATGQAIAEGSRISVDESNTADLDYCLGMVAQMHWEMSLQEMSTELVKKKVGRGAVFPDIAKDKFANDIFIEIEAGSSGKPNAALEIAKAEKIGPLLVGLLQSTGRSIEPIIKLYARLLDSSIDVDEILKGTQIQGGQQQPGAMPGQRQAPLTPGQPANNTVPPGQPRTPQMPPQQRAQTSASAGQ